MGSTTLAGKGVREMAYISSEEVKAVRNKIKAASPHVKFSVRRRHHSTLVVTVLASPYFNDGARIQVNEYHIERNYEGQQLRFLQAVYAIMKENHWDKSDMMTDYFNCAYYMSLNVGEWDKPHAKIPKPRAVVMAIAA